MLKLTDIEIAIIDMRLNRSIRGLASATEHLAEQRQTNVGLTIDTADQIALVQALCRSLPDPSLFEKKIGLLKKRLEAFEDLIFNPQDKAEILAAIAERPNTADVKAQNELEENSPDRKANRRRGIMGLQLGAVILRQASRVHRRDP